ncbi:DUF4191 domain-containing protein [Rarobacter incanus]|uniref:Uncharacterized protein DUF4191 n=1 Tax=Rarobacter incanus TaxID=153494 RepID=A0A542SMJ8_9MICO|nr:DUF4191 domain-containing protein [Rarobacter incanus]TQK75854.1 uncharacterized protein DUF4191 [Rarobacter incanus]
MARKDKDVSEKKPRWYKLVWQAYTFTRSQNPAITWQILGIIVGIIALGFGFGFAVHQVAFWGALSIPLGLLAGLMFLTNRFTKAQYAALDGEIGASRAVLGTLGKVWTFAEEPVAIDAKTQDIVFRGVGRPGIVLIGEARISRIQKLIADEKRRLARAVKEVPVTVLVVGDREGQVPLSKLPKTVRKLKPKLTKAEVGEVERRLRALGGMQLPVPKGMDPTRARISRKDVR